MPQRAPNKTAKRYETIADNHGGTAGLPDHKEQCDLCFLVCVVEKLGGIEAVRGAYRGGLSRKIRESG